MRSATLLLTCLPLLTACGQERDGLAVGDAWIPGEAIDTAVSEMKGSFPQWGADSLAWHILDGGFGPAHLLHAALPSESAAARQEAEIWAGRLRNGEEFEVLARERTVLGEEDPADPMRAPSPFEIGSGRVAAAAGGLEPGQWTGPILTVRGWEIVYLRARGEGHRNRASVQLVRLEFPVGDEAARQRAEQEWNTLPLGGTPRRLRALPSSFRHGRVAAPAAS